MGLSQRDGDRQYVGIDDTIVTGEELDDNTVAIALVDDENSHDIW